MPIIKSAIKKAKQDKKRYAKNIRAKRALKDASKEFEAKPTFEGLKAVQSKVDTLVKKNILTKNTGSRRIKHFAKIAKDAGVKIPAPAKKAVAKPVATKTAAKKPVAKKPAVKKAPAKKAVAKKPAAKK
jgi:ribosomal protein S20